MESKHIAIGILIVLLFISITILFCLLLVKLYIQKIKSYTQQLYQKDLDFQKTLVTTIIETQEQVFNNISQDLHDDAGQQITSINFQLENLKLDSPEWNEILKPVSESLANLSQSIRSVSHSLTNHLVAQQDLFKAISSEMERLKKNTRINFIFISPSNAKREFTVDEKIIIYRIFQECINNILKHAKAKNITVDIKISPRFKITISDDGVGFDMIKAKGLNSLGLVNMKNRAVSIDYLLDINSEQNKGTTITLTENKSD